VETYAWIVNEEVVTWKTFDLQEEAEKIAQSIPARVQRPFIGAFGYVDERLSTLASHHNRDSRDRFNSMANFGKAALILRIRVMCEVGQDGRHPIGGIGLF
jgi:hypothetical protein